MVSCNENTEDGGGSFIPPKPEEESLELTSEANMSFEAKGGNGEITYNLVRNDITAGEDMDIAEPTSPITVGASVEWITILDEESSYGIIKFSVAENTATEERTGLIIGSYNKKSFTVTINQAAAEPIVTPTIEGWAVVGSMTNNWDAASGIKMESIEGYYVARGVEVGASDSFKFVKDGSLQNALGGNGQAAERDYKYPTMKYGSDIRVKEAGVYDLYINEAADNYYVMSEGKHPSEANEILATGEDIWYVTGLGETMRLRNAGTFLSITNVQIDEDGFKLYHSQTESYYGAAEDTTAEVGDEIAISAEAEANIKVNVEAEQKYDIYLKVSENRVWVVRSGEKPDYTHTGTHVEGTWYNNKNFMVSIYSEDQRVTLDCYVTEGVEDFMIPEATYAIGGTEGYTIDNMGCQVANNHGKNGVVEGYITFKHAEDGYEIFLNVISDIRENVKIKYSGKIDPYGSGGSAIVNPKAE